MASYKLLIKPSAAKEIEKVRSRKERRKIVQKISRPKRTWHLLRRAIQ